MSKRWEALFQDLKIGDVITIELFYDLNNLSLPFQNNKSLTMFYNSLTDKSSKTMIKNLKDNVKDPYFPFVNGLNVDLVSLSKFLSCDVTQLQTLFQIKTTDSLSLDAFQNKMTYLLKDYIKKQLK